MPKHNPKQSPFTYIKDVVAFAGFPYIMTYVVPYFYHIILLPESWSLKTMLDMAELQARRNRLDTWLVFSKEDIVKFPAYGELELVTAPPVAKIILSDKLLPAYDIPEDEELKRRKALLNKVIEEIKQRGGYVFGDLSKGGRRPDWNEIRDLSGFQPNGIHKGLEQCPKCGYYRGECLDRIKLPMYLPMVVKVHCLCENDNLCARCAEPLYKYKLNANYYETETRTIWHVPGFCAFDHSCPFPRIH